MPSTITKEELKAEIDRIPNDKLESLHRFIDGLISAHADPKVPGETFMEKMRKIRIDAPPDFSRNIDQYINGEKTLD